MKIQIESTTKFVMVNGTRCRAWEGATDSGIPVIAFIPTIATLDTITPESQAEFEKDLDAYRKPTPALAGHRCWDNGITL